MPLLATAIGLVESTHSGSGSESSIGLRVGDKISFFVGEAVGAFEGLLVGALVGLSEGALVRFLVVPFVGGLVFIESAVRSTLSTQVKSSPVALQQLCRVTFWQQLQAHRARSW